MTTIDLVPDQHPRPTLERNPAAAATRTTQAQGGRPRGADRWGVPLAAGLLAANTHDAQLLEAMIDTIPPVMERAAVLVGPADAPPAAHAEGLPLHTAGGSCGGGHRTQDRFACCAVDWR